MPPFPFRDQLNYLHLQARIQLALFNILQRRPFRFVDLSCDLRWISSCITCQPRKIYTNSRKYSWLRWRIESKVRSSPIIKNIVRSVENTAQEANWQGKPVRISFHVPELMKTWSSRCDRSEKLRIVDEKKWGIGSMTISCLWKSGISSWAKTLHEWRIPITVVRICWLDRSDFQRLQERWS